MAEQKDPTSERRNHPRAGCWGSSWLSLLAAERQMIGYMVDIGLGGCQIETNEPIPAGVGEAVEVLIHLECATLRVAGVIRHMESENHAGIEYTGVSERGARQIRLAMEALMASEKERLAGVAPLGG